MVIKVKEKSSMTRKVISKYKSKQNNSREKNVRFYDRILCKSKEKQQPILFQGFLSFWW